VVIFLGVSDWGEGPEIPGFPDIPGFPGFPAANIQNIMVSPKLLS
jgi:hypothetical protein